MVLGVPWDGGSSYLRGPGRAPARIREQLRSPAGNLCAESGRDLADEPRFHLLGDLRLDPAAAAMARIEAGAAAVLERGARLLCLGGDHSLTAPLVRACARHHAGLQLLQVDAHPDLYDEFAGDRDSHACPMARIMEEGLVGRLVQLGIRTMTPHQRAQAERFGTRVVEMRSRPLGRPWEIELGGPLYVSIDLDGLDPAFAPGVSHPEPGGLGIRELIAVVQGLAGPLVAADIVELNPLRDTQGLTAAVAAKLVKELADKMLEPGNA